MKILNVLIGCEYSGIVREAFEKRGHYCMSCDLLPTEIEGRHYKGDIFEVLYRYGRVKWDILIAFPPCTHLSVSGARWFKYKKKEQKAALQFIWNLLSAPIKKICLENPIGIISTRIRKPDQIIQPWQFGHGETKATCLWLKNLPKLEPTNIVSGRKNRIHMMSPSKDRGKLRSKTYQGIADAMAEQWG